MMCLWGSEKKEEDTEFLGCNLIKLKSKLKKNEPRTEERIMSFPFNSDHTRRSVRFSANS